MVGIENDRAILVAGKQIDRNMITYRMAKLYQYVSVLSSLPICLGEQSGRAEAS